MESLNHPHSLGPTGTSSGGEGSSSSSRGGVVNQPHMSGGGDMGADFDDARTACLELQHACKKRGN